MKKKLVIDISMFILILLEFSRMYLDSFWHELFGIILLILFILHMSLNKNYIRNIFYGKYNISRTMMLIINILLFVSFFATTIFGILSSQDILKSLSANDITIIKLHKITSYITLLCIGFHIGVNFNSMFNGITRIMKNKIIYVLVPLLIIITGIYSFIKVHFWNHLVGKYGFGIIEGNIIINTLNYLSIVLMIAIIVNFIIKRGKKNER